MPHEKTHLVDSESGEHDKRGCCTNGFYDEYVRPCFAEFFGSLIYVFVAGMSVFSADATVIAGGSGLAIIAMAVAFAPVSGGHFNPAITLAVLICGYISPVKALLYVFVQLAGSVAAAGIVRGLALEANYINFEGGAPLVSATTTLFEAMGVELVLGFTLVLVFLVSQVDEENAISPIAHGLVYVVGLLISVELSGGVINPIRSFGLSVVYSSETVDHWEEQWIYYVASAIGAVVAAVIFKMNLASHEKRWNCTESKKMD